MRSLAIVACFAMVSLFLAVSPTWAVNSVVVESKSVQGGAQNVQVGISVTNDLPLRNLVIPLALRSVSGGAFITKMGIKRTVGGRLTGFLDLLDARTAYYEEPDSTNGCHTAIKPFTYLSGFWKVGWTGDSSHSVSIPPVAALYSLGIFFPTDNRLPPGTDGAVPSLHLLVDIGNLPGQFEIDTCCTAPNNHLVFAADSVFVDTTSGLDTMAVSRIPTFTKGVVTVICPKGLPAPIGPVPADGAQNQLDSVILKWGPLADSCGVPVTSYVYFGASCGTMDLVTPRDSTVDSLVAPRLSPNTEYFWKVVLKDFMGRQTTGPCWSFKTGVSAVQYLGGDGIPRDYSLDQNYPNPFNASTVIKFNTKHDGHVRLEVLNILGQEVKTLVDEFRHFGPQAADWDGTDLAGQAVPTGLYFYRLTTSDFTDVKKMVLLK